MLVVFGGVLTDLCGVFPGVCSELCWALVVIGFWGVSCGVGLGVVCWWVWFSGAF